MNLMLTINDLLKVRNELLLELVQKTDILFPHSLTFEQLECFWLDVQSDRVIFDRNSVLIPLYVLLVLILSEPKYEQDQDSNYGYITGYNNPCPGDSLRNLFLFELTGVCDEEDGVVLVAASNIVSDELVSEIPHGALFLMHALIVEIDPELDTAEGRLAAVGHVVKGTFLRVRVDVWFDAHSVQSLDEASRTMKAEGIFVQRRGDALGRTFSEVSHSP